MICVFKLSTEDASYVSIKCQKAFRMVLFLKAKYLLICSPPPPPVQVRGEQKVGTAQLIFSCPIPFPSAAGIDPC